LLEFHFFLSQNLDYSRFEKYGLKKPFFQHKLRKKDTSSAPKLDKAVKEVWCTEMTREYFQKLSDSMPRRMQLVINAKGGSTKY